MSELEQTEQESRPLSALEFRAAPTLGEVDFPSRTIELVVMPYEQETLVEYRGRMVGEICTRGAFSGLERRPNRVKVNRDHDVNRSVGCARSFHPNREDGLVAEVKIARTPLGDETLALAADGVLDASAAFGVMRDGEVWENRNRRRLNRLWLGHIALVPDPAYDGANVLAVREASRIDQHADRLETPNLDTIRAWLLEQRYSQL
jgi:HK97 family phage prohead protease